MAEYPGYLNSEQIVERLKEIGPFVHHRAFDKYHTFTVSDTAAGPFKKSAVMCVASRDGDLKLNGEAMDMLIEAGIGCYEQGVNPCLNQP